MKRRKYSQWTVMFLSVFNKGPMNHSIENDFVRKGQRRDEEEESLFLHFVEMIFTHPILETQRCVTV